VFNKVFLGDPGVEPVKEGSSVMVGCVWALAVLGLIAGLYVNPSIQMTQGAMEQMRGADQRARTVTRITYEMSRDAIQGVVK
jgi:hypothetical protein